MSVTNTVKLNFFCLILGFFYYMLPCCPFASNSAKYCQGHNLYALSQYPLFFLCSLGARDALEGWVFLLNLLALAV